LKNQLLKKHKANIPSLLTVLIGSFEFRIDGKEILLEQFDTFQIPVNIEHEVEGLGERNVFSLLQERNH
jgi:quercetin dioxygenase-like cupin family protein